MKKILCLICASLGGLSVFSQQDSTLAKHASAILKDTLVIAKDSSKFDKINAKMEKLFKIIPVPILTYSTEAGQVFGLAKFNLIHLSKNDTISKPSKLSEVVTFSTRGRVNISVSTELVFKQNKYNVISYVNYKKQPEYVFGIGNNVVKDSIESVTSERFKFSFVGLRRIKGNLLAGVAFDYDNYFKLKTDSISFLKGNNVNPPVAPVSGVDGGLSVGIGLAAAIDSRDNRYNASNGWFILASFMWHPEFLGSKFQYTTFQFDTRRYFNPWLKHVIALQATTMWVDGNAPFYKLSLLGGDSKMRGYYEGGYRDHVLLDAQVEYRMPVWKIFGATAWVGTGRVATSYSDLSIDGFRVSYGAGIRFKVDSKNNTNLRLDFGFGQNGLRGTYINFAEAF